MGSQIVPFRRDKGVGGLLASGRLWGAAFRIPVGNLGNILDTLLIRVAVFFCEPVLMGVLTQPDDERLFHRLSAP